MSMSRKEMELRIAEILSSEGRLIKRITALEACLRECADDLAGEVDNRIPEHIRNQYPSEMRNYLRDTDVVVRARALLAGEPLEPEITEEDIRKQQERFGIKE